MGLLLDVSIGACANTTADENNNARAMKVLFKIIYFLKDMGGESKLILMYNHLYLPALITLGQMNLLK